MVSSFNTWFLQGFERRFALMKRELGLATREAVEVVANSACQLSEIRSYVDSLWSYLANQASVLQRDGQAKFYRARFEVVFTPSVEDSWGRRGPEWALELLALSPREPPPRQKPLALLGAASRVGLL